MGSTFNIQSIKEQIDITDVYEILDYLNADPIMRDGVITSRTVSHGGSSNKLYYYENTQLFVDYTGGGDSFDLFELVSRVQNLPLNDAIWFVVSFLHLDGCGILNDAMDDWDTFDRYKTMDEVNSIERIEFPALNPALLDYYPSPVIVSWVNEHISYQAQVDYNIRFNPIDSSILIPHYDINGHLIGVRKRAVSDDDLVWGKYRPAIVDGKTRNHPIGFNLYGIDKAKDMIKDTGIAIVAEAEKSVLQSYSYGVQQTVAVCGSSISMHQLKLLLDVGAKEVAIAFDADYRSLADAEAGKKAIKLMELHKKLSPYVKVSFLWDKDNKLGYKNSPFDQGAEVFRYLWRNRVVI